MEENKSTMAKELAEKLLLDRAKPVLKTMPGWKCDIRGCTDYNALPAQARAYVDFLEAELGVPIKLVSTGPKRHENAVRRP